MKDWHSNLHLLAINDGAPADADELRSQRIAKVRGRTRVYDLDGNLLRTEPAIRQRTLPKQLRQPD